MAVLALATTLALTAGNSLAQQPDESVVLPPPVRKGPERIAFAMSQEERDMLMQDLAKLENTIPLFTTYDMPRHHVSDAMAVTRNSVPFTQPEFYAMNRALMMDDRPEAAALLGRLRSFILAHRERH